MAKRKRTQAPKKERTEMIVSDALDDDILAKLKAAKAALTQVERENEEQRQEQLRRERKEREKNKSFEELLNEYGDMGNKY